VLRESLSNVARHAAANRVHVALRLDEALVLVVQDDWRGFTADPRGSGVRNMRRRAQTHGGSLRITPGTPRGTRLEWRVPLPA